MPMLKILFFDIRLFHYADAEQACYHDRPPPTPEVSPAYCLIRFRPPMPDATPLSLHMVTIIVADAGADFAAACPPSRPRPFPTTHNEDVQPNPA